jgi:hypothetical protein
MTCTNTLFSASRNTHILCFGDGDDVLSGHEKGRERCLKWESFSGLGVHDIFEKLLDFSCVIRLDVFFVSDGCVPGEWSEVLRKLPYLRELYFEGMRVMCDEYTLFSDQIARMRDLRILSLCGTVLNNSADIYWKEQGKIMSSIVSKRKLRELDLGGCRVSQNGFSAWSESIMDEDNAVGEYRGQSKNRLLWRLNLSGCSVSCDLEFIMLKIPALLDVDVGKQELSHVFGLYTDVWNGIVSCTRGLRFHWSVKRICLSGNGLGISRVASICTGLFSSKVFIGV